MATYAWISQPGSPPTRVALNGMTRQAFAQSLAENRPQARLVRYEPSWERPHARTAPFPLVLFCQELLALLRAGLSLVSSVEALALESADKDVLKQIVMHLRSGMSFSEALGRTAAFPDLFISMVRASERTSDVPSALERFEAHATQMGTLRHKVVSSLIYPSLLMGVGFLVLVFLALYVVPRFSLVYEGMAQPLPWSAMLMMSWGVFVRNHGALIAIAFAGVIAVGALAVSSPALRARLALRVARLPVVGRLSWLFHLSRFYRTVGMLLAGGMPLLEAVRMSGVILPRHFHARAAVLEQAILSGQRASSALKLAELTTPISFQMLAAGEQTGELGSMLMRIAQFYEAHLERRIEQTMRVVEPVVMAIVGVGIGVIVVLMYLPIFELAGAIQ